MTVPNINIKLSNGNVKKNQSIFANTIGTTVDSKPDVIKMVRYWFKLVVNQSFFSRWAMVLTKVFEIHVLFSTFASWKNCLHKILRSKCFQNVQREGRLKNGCFSPLEVFTWKTPFLTKIFWSIRGSSYKIFYVTYFEF